MNQKIMEWPSMELYQNKLVAHDSVKNHLLCDLPNVKKTDETSIPLVMIDTVGTDCEEQQDSEGVKEIYNYIKFIYSF